MASIPVHAAHAATIAHVIAWASKFPAVETRPFCWISGGPGTGMGTLTRLILNAFRERGAVLVAPIGLPEDSAGLKNSDIIIVTQAESMTREAFAALREHGKPIVALGWKEGITHDSFLCGEKPDIDLDTAARPQPTLIQALNYSQLVAMNQLMTWFEAPSRKPFFHIAVEQGAGTATLAHHIVGTLLGMVPKGLGVLHLAGNAHAARAAEVGTGIGVMTVDRVLYDNMARLRTLSSPASFEPFGAAVVHAADVVPKTAMADLLATGVPLVLLARPKGGASDALFLTGREPDVLVPNPKAVRHPSTAPTPYSLRAEVFRTPEGRVALRATKDALEHGVREGDLFYRATDGR